MDLFLLVEHGDPYKPGFTSKFQKDRFMLGRAWDVYQPDLAFTSLLISRKHAEITLNQGDAYIQDLQSKHGTHLNGIQLEPNQLYKLNHGDKITLAKGEAVVVFNNPVQFDDGETVEFSEALKKAPLATGGLSINLDRREVFVDGKPVQLFGKDIELLLLLYENHDKAVSYDEIKTKIWPERHMDIVAGVPDVGNDEITALVYRLRKKLAGYGDSIVSIPRFGYMLELNR